jgi:hypothetical protein
MKMYSRNTDLQSVRPAELHSADNREISGQHVRWPHRQNACVPTRTNIIHEIFR